MRSSLSLVLAASLAVGPAAAQSPPSSPAKGQDSKKYDANRIDCRMVEHTGSRFKRYRVCMTVTEWENNKQRDRQTLERIQSSTCVRGGGC